MSDRVGQKIQMASFDDLFGGAGETPAAPRRGNRDQVIMVPTDRLFGFRVADPDHPGEFEDHPFRVRDDEDMEKLVDSVRESGVLTPLLIRTNPIEDEGGYQIISGHRRAHAARIADVPTVPAIVKEMDDDEAMIAMVDSNFQREKILPSEWGEAFKMKMQALKRKAGRPQKNSYPVDTNFDTADEVGSNMGMGRAQVYRFIRITELIPFLKDLVDENRISMRVAIALSFLSKGEQHSVQNYFEGSNVVISQEQAEKLKKESRALKTGKDPEKWRDLSEKQVWDSLSNGEKPRNYSFTFSEALYSKYFTGDESKIEVQQIICEALDDWMAKKGRKVD